MKVISLISTTTLMAASLTVAGDESAATVEVSHQAIDLDFSSTGYSTIQLRPLADLNDAQTKLLSDFGILDDNVLSKGAVEPMPPILDDGPPPDPHIFVSGSWEYSGPLVWKKWVRYDTHAWVTNGPLSNDPPFVATLIRAKFSAVCESEERVKYKVSKVAFRVVHTLDGLPAPGQGLCIPKTVVFSACAVANGKYGCVQNST